MSIILENILFIILIIILCMLIVVTLMYSIKTTSTDKLIDKVIENKKDNILETRIPLKKYIYLKRGFDIIFALCAIIFIFPGFLICVVLLKYDRVHPIIKVDKIIGYKKKTAKIYVFNTVKDIKEGKLIRSKIGMLLYLTGLSQLPMYFSVLKGDLSIIGLAKIYDLNIDEHLIKEYQYYRPGMATIAAVSKKKKTCLEFNKIYVEEASLKLDRAIFMDVIKKSINIQ